ncbi:MAG: hypothetical protein IKK91_11855 [Ruminococcus sp.]|nr:hypothetical protein [Ruminococcus sp.]
MASSGSFNTTGYQGRYLTFAWSVSSQSVANNTTTIAWTLKGAGTAQSSWYRSGNFKVVINGSTVYSSSTRIQLYDGTLVASGNFTMTHDTAGNKTFSASAEAGIYTVAVNCSGSGSFTLPQIARAAKITAAPNFTDIQNPTINYQNSAGNSVTTLQACISLTGSTDNISYRDIPKTGTSYTFQLTEAERNVLRAATPNSNTLSVIFYIKTVISGQTYYETATRTMTIVDAAPTMANPTYQDSNSTTAAITENNQKIIQKQSSLTIAIPAATAQKYATITKYQVTINGVTREQAAAGNMSWGVLDVSSNITATVKAIDSRGNSVTKSLQITVEAWQQPYAVISCSRENNFYTDTVLNVSPTVSSLSGKNSVTISEQHKKTTDSSYSTPLSVSANTDTTIQLDNHYDWNVKIIVSDRLASTTYNITVQKGMPIVYYDRLKSSTGFNCFPTNENSVESQGLALDDVIYIGSQQLYDRYDFTATAGTVSLLGAYDYRLIEGIFNGFTIPDAYEKAYRLTAQITTNNSNHIGAEIGGMTCSGCTWSGNTFLTLVSSGIVKESDLTLEPVFNYSSRTGLNLKVTNSDAYTGTILAITLHGYIVKKTSSFASVSNYIADEPAT